MTISSRTPEGQPNSCPICNADIRIEPSTPFGDAPCPQCGSLLWFVRLEGDMRYFDQADSAPLRKRLARVLAEQLGLSTKRVENLSEAELSRLMDDLDGDSLDVAELLIEFESELSEA